MALFLLRIAQTSAQEEERALVWTRDSGLFGWIAVGIAAVLLVVGGALFAQRPGRRAFVIYTLLALLPAAVGVTGSAIGRHLREEPVLEGTVAEHVVVKNEEDRSPADEEFLARERQTRLPRLVGWVSSCPLVVLGILGYFLASRERDARASERE